jgi:aryl-alcohol dehydrogenase-like predicted oxidoreductase
LERTFLTKYYREGKIKHIGLSEVTSTTLRRACKIAPVAAVQMEYSPFVLDIEGPTGSDMLATCRELGVTIVAYSPIGRGLLTTAFTNREDNDPNDRRQAAFPRFMEKNRDANIKLVNQFKALADKKGCTMSQLALAWLLRQDEGIIPIPGTKRIKYLEENWGALDVHLSDEEEHEIRKFVDTVEVVGSRVPPRADNSQILVDTREEA